ncbi:hypothetical protein CCP4SC76_810004 [Gammaproteobacteria bacterium]
MYQKNGKWYDKRDREMFRWKIWASMKDKQFLMITMASDAKDALRAAYNAGAQLERDAVAYPEDFRLF